jgi:hypothetical protein
VCVCVCVCVPRAPSLSLSRVLRATCEFKPSSNRIGCVVRKPRGCGPAAQARHRSRGIQRWKSCGSLRLGSREGDRSRLRFAMISRYTSVARTHMYARKFWSFFSFSKSIFCRPVPNLRVTIRNFSIAVRHPCVSPCNGAGKTEREWSCCWHSTDGAPGCCTRASAAIPHGRRRLEMPLGAAPLSLCLSPPPAVSSLCYPQLTRDAGGAGGPPSSAGQTRTAPSLPRRCLCTCTRLRGNTATSTSAPPTTLEEGPRPTHPFTRTPTLRRPDAIAPHLPRADTRARRAEAPLNPLGALRSRGATRSNNTERWRLDTGAMGGFSSCWATTPPYPPHRIGGPRAPSSTVRGSINQAYAQTAASVLQRATSPRWCPSADDSDCSP